MTYESMIDDLNESTQFQMMQYVIESFDIEPINEGILDVFKSFKNAVLGFFRKAKEVLTDFIHRITNKENIAATKGQAVATQIVNNTDQNCNIKPEKLPEVSQKIEMVNTGSVERVAVIRKQVVVKNDKHVERVRYQDALKDKETFNKTMGNKNAKLVFGDGEPKIPEKQQTKQEPDKPKVTPPPSKMKLSSVFLKDSYVDTVLKDSDFYLGEVSKINKIVNESYKGKYRLHDEFWREIDYVVSSDRRVRSVTNLKYNEKLYEKPEKELYDTSYYNYPKELMKVVQEKLSNAKNNNNKLSANIDKSIKLLNESEKIMNEIKPEQMDRGRDPKFKYDKEGKLINGNDYDRKVQNFSLEQLKEGFNKEIKAYREIIDSFKITLKEISEEITRCNQYIQVIKAAM